MKYQVTRTYNANCDILKMFDNLKDASEFYFECKSSDKNCRIRLEEVK